MKKKEKKKTVGLMRKVRKMREMCRRERENGKESEYKIKDKHVNQALWFKAVRPSNKVNNSLCKT